MAAALLFLAAVFWGAGNVANKTVLEHLAPLSVAGMRCLIAGLLLLPFARGDLMAGTCRDWVWSALRTSGLFAAAVAFQQMAYQSTTVTNASFLVNTTTVMTPVLAWIVLRQRPGTCIVLAAPMTLLGAYLMAGSGFSAANVQAGDWFCLASAAAYSGWMLAVGQHARRHGRPLGTALVQLVAAGVLTLPLALWVDGVALAGARAALPELLFLALFSTALPFAIMTWAQRHVTAATAAVITSAEGPVGALGAYLVLAELTTISGLIGAGLILGCGLWTALAPPPVTGQLRPLASPP